MRLKGRVVLGENKEKASNVQMKQNCQNRKLEATSIPDPIPLSFSPKHQ